MDAVAERIQADLLATAYLAWVIAVPILEAANSALLDTAPAPEELQAHRKLLGELLTVGKTLETKVKSVKTEDLSPFLSVIATNLGKLEGMHFFWEESYGS